MTIRSTKAARTQMKGTFADRYHDIVTRNRTRLCIGLDTDYSLAFAKSQMGAGMKVPREGTVFVSVRDDDKPLLRSAMRDLQAAARSFDATAKAGDVAAIKAGFGEFGKTCKACHDLYRAPEDDH